MQINEIELYHLRCVAALAEELNFGRAAERLHMSQPPLTRLVAEVEKAVGAKLFARTTRRVSLTPVGKVFVAEAQAVLARAEEARRGGGGPAAGGAASACLHGAGFADGAAAPLGRFPRAGTRRAH